LAILLGLVAVASGHARTATPVAFASSEGIGAVPGEIPVSRCAPVSFSPHVVKVGQKIVASAGPATDQCGGLAEKVSWSWNVAFMAGLDVASGCGPTSSSCVLRAVTATGTPGNRYTEGCIDGASPFGGWESCDYYAVEGCSAGARASDVSIEACCATEPELTATAHVVRGGSAVQVQLIASRLGRERQCGRATLTTNRGAVLAVRRSGSREVGTATIRGRQSCFTALASRVQLQKGGEAGATANVDNGTPKIEVARAHRTAGGTIQVLARIADLRSLDACGKVKIDTTVAHATRPGPTTQVLAVRDFRGTTATGRARLNRTYQCLTATRIRVQQEGLAAETARAVRVTGKDPTQCVVHRPPAQ
jgi:hypothetical protein